MNNKIKVKVSKGDWGIEVEGDAEIVMRHLEEIKNKVLGEIPLLDSDTAPLPPAGEFEYESLKNVVLKQLPGVEVEWVLIYAFYASNFGEAKFNRDILLGKYRETDRISASRKSNLFNNIRTLVQKNWAQALNDTDFLLTDAGKKKAEEILKPTVPGKQRKVSKRKPVLNNLALNPGISS